MLLVIGWLVLFVIAGWLWFVTIGGAMFELGFTGKVSAGNLIPLGFAIGMSYLVVIQFPFDVAVRVVQ